MADLIDRASLIEKLHKRANDWRGTFSGDAYRNAVQMIKKEPAVDAEPVKHSYWESFNVAVCSGKKNRDLRVLARNCFRCDRCRNTAEASSNYCPYCGARMDGGAAGGI